MRLRIVCFLLLLTACAGSAGPVQHAVAPSSPSPTPVATPAPPSHPVRPAVAARSVARAPQVHAGAPATIAVSVATIWGSRTAPRPVDAPALENPVRIKTWLANMTTEQRRALGPTRVNTSVLYAERVIVTSIVKGWAHVVVPSQKSPLDTRGYPGWVPVRQLSPLLPPANASIATVRARTTMLRTSGGTAALEISYATRLPVIKAGPSSVSVWSPDGRTLVARASDVVVRDASQAALSRTAEAIITDAKRFLGLPYLWDGSSAYGFDCSGITYSVFRTHGILLPRDSFAQVKAGRGVARSAMAPGDLVFFATNGTVHHVGIFLGDNKMLHAPKTGRSVEIVSLSTPAYDNEFFAARRFLG